MSDASKKETIELTEAQRTARRKRNVAMAICLALFVIIFYAITVVKLGPQIMNRAI